MLIKKVSCMCDAPKTSLNQSVEQQKTPLRVDYLLSFVVNDIWYCTFRFDYVFYSVSPKHKQNMIIMQVDYIHPFAHWKNKPWLHLTEHWELKVSLFSLFK